MNRQPDKDDRSTEQLKEQIADLQREIVDLSSRIDQSSDEIRKQKDRIEELLRSRSWAMTKPYRMMGIAVKSALLRLRQRAYGAARRLAAHAPLSPGTKTRIRRRLFGDMGLPAGATADTHAGRLDGDGLAAGDTDVPPEWRVQTIRFDDTEDRHYAYQAHEPPETVVKLIAFYLPQFHPIPENDQWWGKGFTEWTNVTRARAAFTDHHQPRLPADLGFYDLRIPDVMRQQAELARNYGIHGFNYFFYWFAGKTLLETPLRNMLRSKEIEMPFCLTWANENWTRRWDGADDDILIAQEHNREDSLAFIKHVLQYMQDERYITIDGKPVLMVYRADIIPKMKQTTELWREEARRRGFPDLYLVAIKSFGISDVEKKGFDAAAEYPPHTTQIEPVASHIPGMTPDFRGWVYDYGKAVSEAVRKPDPAEKTLGGVMLEWDNSARKANRAHVFRNFSLVQYKQWLSNQCHRVFTSKTLSASEKLVLINAWNEWAEGTYLEPDDRLGHGYLDATFQVIRDFDAAHEEHLAFANVARRSETAVIVHLHYTNLWPEIYRCLEKAGLDSADIYVTATSLEAIQAVRSDIPNAHTMLVENRGRDILPFLSALRHISPLEYTCVCKIHSKKSVYRPDGDLLREGLLGALLGEADNVERIVGSFLENEALGLVVPERSLLAHDANNMASNHKTVAAASSAMGISFSYDVFPAGSMFWFRPAALSPMLKLGPRHFDLELGLSDGTMAHAIERLFVTVAKDGGYSMETV